MKSTLFSLARKFADQIQYGFFEEKQSISLRQH